MGSQTQFGMPDPMMGMGTGMGANPLVAAIQAAMQRPPLQAPLPSFSTGMPGGVPSPPSLSPVHGAGFGAAGPGIPPLVSEAQARQTGLASGYPVIPINFPRPTNVAPYLGGGIPHIQARALGIPRRFREGTDN